MRIAVTGASGTLGTALVSTLRADGHDVSRLVRRAPGKPDEIGWDPAAGTVDDTRLAGTEAVVHLAGASIARPRTIRWTDAWKKEILHSRVQGTTTLARALARLDAPPRVLLSQSGSNFYGDTGDREVTEASPGGEGFLADVTRAWESSTAEAEQAGVRVAHLRTGPVLAKESPLIKLQLPIFKAGLGGTLGDGRDWLSWIALDDVLGAIRHLLTADEVSGPVNLTSPNPATNAEFTKAFASALHRPAVMPVPKLALRLALGELADELPLLSQKVLPTVLVESGYIFAEPQLAPALEQLLD